MFLTDNQLEEFKKTETFKMLIKGTYLGVMENDFKNMTKKQLVDWCFKRESEIFDLKQQLSLTEKALELACEKLPMEYEYCSSHPERYNLQDEYGCDEPYWVEEGGCEFDDPAKCLECVVNYFKAKAKEMMKSE